MAENKKSEPGIPQTLNVSLFGVKTLDDAIRRDTGREIGPWKRKWEEPESYPPGRCWSWEIKARISGWGLYGIGTLHDKIRRLNWVAPDEPASFVENVGRGKRAKPKYVPPAGSDWKEISEHLRRLYQDATSIMGNRKMGQELVGELLIDLCEPDKETGLPKYYKWDGHYGWLKMRLKWKAKEVWEKERKESRSALGLTVPSRGADYEDEDWEAGVYESGELPPEEEDVVTESSAPAGVSSSWSDTSISVGSDPARGIFFGKKWDELEEDAKPRAECPRCGTEVPEAHPARRGQVCPGCDSGYYPPTEIRTVKHALREKTVKLPKAKYKEDRLLLDDAPYLVTTTGELVVRYTCHCGTISLFIQNGEHLRGCTCPVHYPGCKCGVDHTVYPFSRPMLEPYPKPERASFFAQPSSKGIQSHYHDGTQWGESHEHVESREKERLKRYLTKRPLHNIPLTPKSDKWKPRGAYQFELHPSPNRLWNLFKDDKHTWKGWEAPAERRENIRAILTKQPMEFISPVAYVGHKYRSVYIPRELKYWKPKICEEIPVPPGLKPTFISGLGLPSDITPSPETPWLWALEHPHIMEHAKYKWLSGNAAEERVIRYLDRDHELPAQTQREEALHSLRKAMEEAWEQALSNLEEEAGTIIRDAILHRVALDYRTWELRDLDVSQGKGKTWEEISRLPEWDNMPARNVQNTVEPYLEKLKQEWKRLRWRVYLQCTRQLKKRGNAS